LRNGGTFRNRTHKLGDIVASAPLYIGTPNGYTQSTSYFNFVTANATRSPMIYVGADDGMLHAFNANTGNELFAYIPNGVYSNLIKLANPYYNQSHQFFVNGSPQAADVQFNNNTWHTVLVGSEGAGGSTLFGLDVTAPDSITNETQLAQTALWEFTDTLDMGLSFSTPAFALTNTTAPTTAAATTSGWMVFAGNGYNSPSQKPVLYAINPQTGAMVARVDLCAAVPTACNLTLANGLSSVAVVNNYGQVSLPANTVYAGDLQGNLWRVDISNANPTLWAVTVIYQARSSLGAMQPITTTPAVTLNPQFPQVLGTLVNIGTGQLLGLPDLATTGTQTLYAIFDPPSNSAPPLGFSGIPTRTNLVAQTLASSTADGVSVLVETTVQPVTFPSNRGWYVDFSLNPGERIVTNPELGPGGAVILTVYQPNSSSCTGGGNAWLMVLNYATGGSFPLPELDLNGSTVLNAADQTATGLNPVGMSMGSVYAAEPTVLGGTGGAGTGSLSTLETSVSTGAVLNTQIRGQAMKRISWWEVRH
jgi:type IV pilus assembly protein PilY1